MTTNRLEQEEINSVGSKNQELKDFLAELQEKEMKESIIRKRESPKKQKKCY